MSTLELPPPFVATAKQRELARAWHEPAARQVLIAGAIRSGKTQAAGRLIVETAIEQPCIFLVARATYRELEDSTKRAMLKGDGAIGPLIPPELVAEYRASDNLVRLRNGAEILFRSLEEGNVSKLLNLTLGGVFIDQIEELDGGKAGEDVFNTLLGRLSDARGPRKLLAVANPGPLTHWVYRRLVDPRTCDAASRYVHVTLTDNAANLPADYVESMEATKTTRSHWWRTFVRGEWGAFEGAAFTEFDEQVHVVAPFAIPATWERFEAMDFGRNNPTAWYLHAVDYDGNLIVADEYYSPGLVRDHAEEILRRRREWWEQDDGQGGRSWNACYADPSIKNRYGISDRKGRELSVELEFNDYGFSFAPGQNDRRAGYGRICELLYPESGRLAPEWATHLPAGGPTPRLFVFSRCEHLVEQLRSAPVENDGQLFNEAVDGDWESAHGHSIAALRYAVMSRPSPTRRPPDKTEMTAAERRAEAAHRRAFERFMSEPEYVDIEC